MAHDPSFKSGTVIVIYPRGVGVLPAAPERAGVLACLAMFVAALDLRQVEQPLILCTPKARVPSISTTATTANCIVFGQQKQSCTTNCKKTIKTSIVNAAMPTYRHFPLWGTSRRLGTRSCGSAPSAKRGTPRAATGTGPSAIFMSAQRYVGTYHHVCNAI
jgi:hypothetical protein